MLTLWYRDNCPLCGPEGELAIARMESGRLVLVCAECWMAFLNPDDVKDTEKSIDVLEHKLSAPTEDEIDAAGWGHLRHHKVEFESPQ